MTTDIDPVAQAGLIGRQVRTASRDGEPTKIVVATRTYATDRADLWDALTNAERLPRWFLPVTGDLKEGGRYQFEGNAGGIVESCQKPDRFAATWEFAGGVSWVQVTLTENGDGTTLELAHESPIGDHWKQFGAGATGVGWDLGLLGLGLHLSTGEGVDPATFEAWSTSEEGKAYVRQSSDGWYDAEVGGGADPADARAAADRTAGFYTGEAEPQPSE